ncbi:PQQ-dependent sugar dehydrogenase [Metabacillus malikii]|uniref:Glucose/arabinose dehydrogenase n=1 Tax=Metabacillus malikii TaxID=1504265 RepID=A0ABT9ZA65_9BACI|nr:sorbosone dehydrogenase family protein [Metabacillus malikii]MDQ0229150.1 glucose/arabinose dehydrogenase [Metabacillus malikii]
MKKVFIVYLVFIFLLVGCSSSRQQDVNIESNREQKNDQLEVIADNLNVPWSITKLDDTFYLTERPGTIVKVEDGIVERQSVELAKKVSTTSEDGVLGFVLAPDFKDSGLAYGYYTYEDNGGMLNRVVTLQLEGNIWKEERVLLDKIPGNSWHNGGRLKIGPDEKLYVTTGDAYENSISQDPASLAGKILRMNLDGTIPTDNPYPDSYVYSYGHRNPQGLTWLPDRTLYASEHGNSSHDEINKIEAGLNYGWPVIEGDEKQEGMVPPLFHSGHDATWAPSGMEYHDGKLYVAALRGTAVLEFNLETGEYQKVISELGRIRDVYIEDNYLYFISNNRDGRGEPVENDDKLYSILLSEFD